MIKSKIASNFVVKTDADDNLISFDFRKLPCGQPLSSVSPYNRYCSGKNLRTLASTHFPKIIQDIGLIEEKQEFFVHVEWEALRSIIAKYLGIASNEIDKNRCLIDSIEHSQEITTISGTLLPPGI